jgi:thioredoxin reductase
LGRARRNIILIDDNNPRNAVTQKSHGFITRDGIKPKEFREIAHKELDRYPSVIYSKREVTSVIKINTLFELVTSDNERYQSKTIIISTGLKDVLPKKIFLTTMARVYFTAHIVMDENYKTNLLW